LPAAQSSFLNVDNSSVLLSAWKQAEDGAGTVMRFIELSGKPGGVSVRGPLLNNSAAVACNAVELCDVPVRGGARGLLFETRANQIFTLWVNGAREAWPPNRPR
jgi:alpha-mannosidase